MIIIRYNKSARVVSYRVMRRFLDMFNLSMIQVSDLDEHYHAILNEYNNLVGHIQYIEK